MSTVEGITIEAVDGSSRDAFVAYAREHGAAHDDSFTGPEDLAVFDPAREPAILARAEDGAVVGAASLMLEGYATEGMGRFRILHAADPSVYPALLRAIRGRVPDGLAGVFLFLPEEPGPIREPLEDCSFAETRRAYILAHRSLANVRPLDPPSGTRVRPAKATDAEDWMHVLNAAFHGAPGRYDLATRDAAEHLARDRVMADGTLIAFRGGTPAGVILTVADETDPYAAEVETLAVTPGNQGIGLGRCLLHSAVAAVARSGRLSVTLSVSTTNRRAIALYMDAGFEVDDVRACWEASIVCG